MFPLHDSVGVSLFMLTPVLFLLTGVAGLIGFRQTLGRALIVMTVTYLSWWVYVVTHAVI